MNPSTVEKITPHPNEPAKLHGGLCRLQSPSAEVGFLCPDCNCHRAVARSRPGTKVALDAATRLRKHLLDPSVCPVGLFGVALFVSILYLWINLRFAARNIDVSEGSSFFSKAIRHPLTPAGQSTSTSARSCCACFRSGIVIFSLLLRLIFRSVGHVPSLSLRRIIRDCGPSLWYRPWVLCVSPPVL